MAADCRVPVAPIADAGHGRPGGARHGASERCKDDLKTGRRGQQIMRGELPVSVLTFVGSLDGVAIARFIAGVDSRRLRIFVYSMVHRGATLGSHAFAMPVVPFPAAVAVGGFCLGSRRS
jgi:hypothetical protein